MLPILRHALSTNPETGTIFFPEHFLKIAWPTTLDFMLNPFGPELCDHLSIGPATLQDTSTAMSMVYLAQKMDCPALWPWVQTWAREAPAPVRRVALNVLANRGAPADRALLLSLADSPDADLRLTAAGVLYEFGDPATAPTLRKLLVDPAAPVRLEAIAGVIHLIDVDGARALTARRSDPSTPKDETEKIASMTDQLAEWTGADRAALAKGDAGTWQTAIDRYWKRRDAFFALHPDDRRLTRDELLLALDHWIATGRLASESSDPTSWIESRHVLSIASAGDIPKLVAVRGRVLRRHSDEALDEVAILDRMISILRRRNAGAAKPNE